MKSIAYRVLFISLLCISTPASSEEFDCHFEINQNNYTEYARFLDGRDPLGLEETRSEYFSRHMLELLVFQKALHLGNCGCEVTYVPNTLGISHKRSIADVASGRKISHPIAGFSSELRFEGRIFRSIPILSADDFFVGLFTHKNRQDVLSITTPDAIRKLTFTASESWAVDIEVIDNFGFAKQLADSWATTLKLLQTGRADVMMQPLTPREDFGFQDTESGEYFLPIPNVKLRFGAAREYFVSKTHQRSEEFLGCLNNGLEQLKNSGFLYKAHVDAGVINPRAQDWAIIK